MVGDYVSIPLNQACVISMIYSLSFSFNVSIYMENPWYWEYDFVFLHLRENST